MSWVNVFGSCTTKKLCICCKLVLLHQYLEDQIILLFNF